MQAFVCTLVLEPVNIRSGPARVLSGSNTFASYPVCFCIYDITLLDSKLGGQDLETFHAKGKIVRNIFWIDVAMLSLSYKHNNTPQSHGSKIQGTT